MDSATANNPNEQGDTVKRKTTRILVVDDEEPVRKLIETMLTLRGYDVRTCGDATAAKGQIAAFEPHLVITDIIMPEGEGMELIRYLRHISEPPSAIAMSGNRLGRQFLGASELLGARRTLAKPFDEETLVETVESCLEKAQR
ncbi:MAG: response regulator [Spirochaetaceae bacterium]